MASYPLDQSFLDCQASSQVHAEIKKLIKAVGEGHTARFNCVNGTFSASPTSPWIVRWMTRTENPFDAECATCHQQATVFYTNDGRRFIYDQMAKEVNALDAKSAAAVLRGDHDKDAIAWL